MHTLFLVAIAVLLALPLGAESKTRIIESVEGRVVGISDGDTFDVTTLDRKTYRVRIGGIDAPEKAQPYGNRAKEALSDLIFGRTVMVHVYKLDRHESKYGKRRIGNVFLKDADIGLAMVRGGFAWHYVAYQSEQSAADRAEYAAAEQEARRLHRGLWQSPTPTPPWDWRRR